MASVQVLVVGGGGGGGGSLAGGGGGGGGVIYNPAYNISVQTYTVTVGNGGNGGTNTVFATNGQNSVFGTLTAVGGGRGGGTGVWNSGYAGSSGGSGGGGEGSYTTTYPGGSGTAGQGNNGGTSIVFQNNCYFGAGGGGAGAVGSNPTSSNAGNGGAGSQYSISGSSLYYGAGGGGGLYRQSAVSVSRGIGGSSIGGNGCDYLNGTGVVSASTAGAANTGSGGGGGGENTGTANGAAGGSGIVIIRYVTGTITATGGTVTTVGSDTVHTFTSSGTFTVTAAVTTSSDYVAQKFRPLSQTKFINDANLLAYWSMDGNSNDSKGSFNGTDTNVSYVAGKFGSASSYNGTSSKIQLPNSMITTTGSFSVWIKTSNSDQGILGMQDVAPGNTSNWYVSILGVTTAGKIRATWGWQNTTLTITSTRSVDDNLWHHLVITSNSLNTYLYMDGTLEGAFTASVATAYNTYLNLGVCMGSTDWGYSTATWRYFNGLIEDAAFFNRMLSREEVVELYQGTIWAEDLPSIRPINGLYSTSLINDANLVSYWRLDGNSRDSKGSNHGTDTAMSYSSAAGRFGQGAIFNGSSSLISCGNAGIPTGSSARTLCGWFYRIADTGWSMNIIVGWGAAASGTYSILACYNSKAYFWDYGSDVGGTTTIQNNTWNHFAATYDGTTERIYLNGILEGTKTVAINTTATSLFLGKVSTDAAVNGYIEDVAVFSRALSATEIFAIYSAGLSTPFRPLDSVLSMRSDGALVSYWKLDGNANDSKGTKNGTANAVSYISGVNGQFGQSAVFNGSSSYILSSVASTATDNFGVSMWVNPFTLPQLGAFICNGGDVTGGCDGWWLGVANGGGRSGSMLQALYPCVAWINTGYTFPSANTWYHVVMTRVSGVLKFYVNGTMTSNTTYSTNPIAPVTETRMGANNGARYFNGAIDDVAIFNRALTSYDVMQLYTQGRISGYWKLNGNSIDYSGNGSHGTDTSVTYVVGRNDKCASFNGSSSKVSFTGSTLPLGNQSRSIVLWVYPNDAVSARQMITYGTASTGQSFAFQLSGNKMFAQGYAVNAAAYSNTTISNGKWAMLGVTYEASGAVTYYKDGKPDGTTTLSSVNTTGQSGTIGYGWDGYFNGLIEDVRIYSSLLSASDFAKIYTQSKGRFGII